MIGFGAQGGSGDTSVNALTDLLSVISDPAAAKKRLAELEDKKVELKADLDKVTEINKQNEALKLELDAKQSKLDASLVDLSSREAALQARQAACDTQSANLNAQLQEFTVTKKNYEDTFAAREAEYKGHAAALSKSMEDHAKKVKADLADAAAALNSKMEELETSYADKLAKASALEADATKKHEAASIALSAAEEKKTLYEGKLLALQNLIK